MRWLVESCVPVVLGAVTTVGTTGPDRHAWADVAATSLSANKPEAPSASSPGTGSEPRRPRPSPSREARTVARLRSLDLIGVLHVQGEVGLALLIKLRVEHLVIKVGSGLRLKEHACSGCLDNLVVLTRTSRGCELRAYSPAWFGSAAGWAGGRGRMGGDGLSVSARSRSRSLGAPFAHPDDRAFGQPIETGAQTCQQIASMGLVRQDPPHHSPQRSSRSGSHDRGAADRGGPFVHPAGGKPGGGQLPACGKAVISR